MVIPTTIKAASELRGKTFPAIFQRDNAVRRPISDPICQSSRREHERPLTQTIRVATADSVPPGYRRVRVQSPAIYAKVQVLSSKLGRPIFVETESLHSQRRVAYWIHEDVIPDLTRWLRVRVFPLSDLVDDP